MYAVPILAVVALAVGLLAFQAYSEAQRANAARAEADALRLAGDARATLDSRPDLGLLLAMEAAARSKESALQGMPLVALTHGPGPRRFDEVGQPIAAAALDGSGSHAVVRVPGKVVLWDVDAGAPVAELPASSDVVAIAADGSMVALGTPDGVAIHEWGSRDASATCRIAGGTVTELALSDPGDRVALVTEDTSGQDTVALLDSSTCEVHSNLTGVPQGVRSVAFDHVGSYLALGTEEDGAGVWEIATGLPLGPMGTGDETVRAVAFGDDDMLAWATDDGRLLLGDIGNPESDPEEFRVHGRDQVNALAYSASDDSFLTGAASGEMRRVDLSADLPIGPALEALPPLDYPGRSFEPLDLAVDGSRGVSIDPTGRVVVWDLAGRPPLGPELASGREMSLVAAMADGSMVTSDGQELLHLADATAEPQSLTQRDDVLVLTAGPTGWAAGTASGEILTGDATPASVRTIETFPGQRVIGLAALPAGGWAGVMKKGSAGGTVVVFPEHGEPQELAMPETPTALVSDGRWLYVGDMNGDIHVLDGDDLQVPDRVTDAHEFDIGSMALNPQGSVLATGSDDRAIALWDVAEDGALTERSRLRGHEERVRSLTFSPDARWLASAGEEPAVRLWDLETQRAVGDPIRVAGNDPDVVFAPSADRQLLVAAETLSSWDMREDRGPRWRAGSCRSRTSNGPRRPHWLRRFVPNVSDVPAPRLEPAHRLVVEREEA